MIHFISYHWKLWFIWSTIPAARPVCTVYLRTRDRKMGQYTKWTPSPSREVKMWCNQSSEKFYFKYLDLYLDIFKLLKILNYNSKCHTEMSIHSQGSIYSDYGSRGSSEISDCYSTPSQYNSGNIGFYSLKTGYNQTGHLYKTKTTDQYHVCTLNMAGVCYLCGRSKEISDY